MITFPTLRYLWYRLRSPSTADFTDMGLGIEARYKRCQRYWDKHLASTKCFIDEVTEGAEGRCSVLGAGRLLDVDISLLCERFDEVRLYDLDPTVLPFWKRVQVRFPQLHLHQMDITGSLTHWTNELKKVGRKASGEEVASLLSSLSTYSVEVSADTIISLNILSQLSIYWRERVESMTRGRDLDEELLDNALSGNQRALESAHLEVLRQATRNVILVSDEYFHYYTRDSSEWLTEPALSLDLPLKLEDPFHLERTSRWFWHIAPQGIEQEGYGVIHEVSASFFSR